MSQGESVLVRWLFLYTKSVIISTCPVRKQNEHTPPRMRLETNKKY